MDSEGATVPVVAAIALSSTLGVLSSRASAGGHSLTSEVMPGLSAGVLLAVAWLHLLDDAQARVQGLTEYPAVSAAMLLGYLLMATLQATLQPCHHTPHLASAGLPLLSPGSAPAKRGEPAQKAVFHVFEASVSLHSILIGLGFGLGDLDDHELSILGVALCIHQYLEGLTVGMLGRTHGLSRQELRFTLVLFSLSLPAGVVAGIAARRLYADLDDSLAFRWGSALLNGLAAGTLTHIGVHMLGAHGSGERPPHPPTPPQIPGAAIIKPLAATPPQPQAGAQAEHTHGDGCSHDPQREHALHVMLGEPVAPRGRLLSCVRGRCQPSAAMLRMLSASFGAFLMAVLAIWAP
jgi:zinc transporter ZupT